MYPMSDEDRAIQDKTRRFVDEELIPHEVEAEMNEGQIDPDVKARHEQLVRDLGLGSMNIPKEFGGQGFTMFQQVLVSEQIGRVTNALGWVLHTPPPWAPAVATEHQMETWIAPTIRGEKSECYAITEEGAGSDVDAHRGNRAPRRRRVRAERREDARHLVQPRRLRLLRGQARRRRA